MHIQENLQIEDAAVNSRPQTGIAALLLATLGAACSTTQPTKSIIDSNRPAAHEIVEVAQPKIIPLVNDPKIEEDLKRADAWLSVLHKAETADPGGLVKLDGQSKQEIGVRIDLITRQLKIDYDQLSTEQKNSTFGRVAQSTYQALSEMRRLLVSGDIAPIAIQTHQTLHESFDLCDVSFTTPLRDCIETSVASRSSEETQSYFHKLLGLNATEAEAPRYATAAHVSTTTHETRELKEKTVTPAKTVEAPTQEAAKELVATKKDVKWDPFVTKQQAPRSAAEDAATFFGVAGGIAAIWKIAMVLGAPFGF